MTALTVPFKLPELKAVPFRPTLPYGFSEVEVAKLINRNMMRAPYPELVVQLEESISRYGILNPPLVRNYTVLDGYFRVEAARKAGLTRIPVFNIAGGPHENPMH